MKKIINSKMYNTDTATQIGVYNYLCPGQLAYVCETLYRKTTGEYFLAGEGGAASQYARPTEDGNMTGGWGIVPMTQQEAMAWTEEYLDAETYIATFGDVPE